MPRKKQEINETTQEVKKAKRGRPRIVPNDELEEKDFFYGDNDDDDDDLIDVVYDEEEETSTDEITEEELEIANAVDIGDFFEEGENTEKKEQFKKTYKPSEKSEEIRKKFYKICEKYNSGDPELRKSAYEDACNELESFIHFVIRKQYASYSGKYYDDLLQEGRMGIFKGMEKYSPEKSLPTTYFNLYIVHEISKFIDTQVNKTSSHYSTNLTKINRVIDKFDQQGRKWNETDIAVETGLNMETVLQCLRIKVSKNEIYYETDEILEASINEHSDSPEQIFIKNERDKTLYQAISTLSPEEIYVLKCRFGLANSKVISYKDIAKQMNVSIEKVRKYRHDAIKKLRHKSIMRNTFKDYINESEDSITENDVAIIPEAVADNSLAEIEEIEFTDEELAVLENLM